MERQTLHGNIKITRANREENQVKKFGTIYLNPWGKKEVEETQEHAHIAVMHTERDVEVDIHVGHGKFTSITWPCAVPALSFWSTMSLQEIHANIWWLGHDQVVRELIRVGAGVDVQQDITKTSFILPAADTIWTCGDVDENANCACVPVNVLWCIAIDAGCTGTH